MATYVRTKGMDKGYPADKSPDEVFMKRPDLGILLNTIKTSKNEFAKRDHAIVFIAFQMALRAGEAAILERRHFRHVESKVVYVPTLKKSFMVKHECPECGKNIRTKWTNAGKKVVCKKCGEKVKIPKELRKIERKPPQISTPILDASARRYMLSYVGRMRRNQKFLFEGATQGAHISVRHVQRIFATWTEEAGLSKNYGFHSLRHGRGSHVWEVTKDRFLLKEVMRHATIEMGERYVHQSPEALSRFERMFNKENQ